MDDELTPAERDALDTWTVPDTPDVVDAVMARRYGNGSGSDRRVMWIGVAVCLLVVAALAGGAILRRSRLTVERSIVAEHRTTEEIGRATLVMEADASIHYTLSPDRTQITQDTGNVFYRVEPGRTSFVIDTPQGTVTVRGTCFRVEVQPMKKGLIGAASGSALTALVLVSVYEGKVVTASPAGNATVEAGELVELTKDAPPKKRAMALSSVRQRPSTSPQASAPGATVDDAVEPEGSVDTATLLEEKAALQEKVRRLEEALDQAQQKESKDQGTYDLDQATLQEMANNCELRWDSTGLGAEPSRIPEKDLDELGLSEEEREVIDRAFTESHAQVIEAVRRAYTEITGDENTGSLAASSMFSEVRDKVRPEALKLVFQKLARERAGIEPPADPKTMTPLERMYRAITSQGDRLEAALAAELGPDEAKRLRDLRKGWGSRHRSSYGCPGSTP